MKYSLNKVLGCFLALGLIILAGILCSMGPDKVSKEIAAVLAEEAQVEAAAVQVEQPKAVSTNQTVVVVTGTVAGGFKE